jgi:Amt family ammonium transporter
MHAGFAMLETGSVRSTSKTTVLIKNLLNICISAGGWFLLGYGLAFGEDKGMFVGGSLFVGVHADYKLQKVYDADEMSFHYLYWFFQWAFCATAATIVSGSTAERCKLSGFSIFAAIMTTFVYPVIVHWTWGGGWLSEQGYLDFAGSGIVHLCGGIAALVGAVILGPRTGRFDPARAGEFEAHNVAIVILGTLILWFGWYGFNCGSTVSMTGDGAANAQTASTVAMNTTLAGAMGGLAAFGIQALMTRTADVAALANGILAGLVSITAGCDGVYAWAAVFIGLFGGLLYLGASAGLKRIKVDDPVDAFPVHGACGIWGVMAVAFFNSEQGVFFGGEGKIIGVQLLGVLAIVAWSGLLSLAIFVVLRQMNLLRKTSTEVKEPDSPAFSPPKPVDAAVKQPINEPIIKREFTTQSGEPEAKICPTVEVCQHCMGA